MNRLPPEEPTGPCPARPTLIAYQAGRLSGPDEDRLAGHVETCETCISTIRELSNTPLDAFEAKLLRFCADRSDLLDTSHPAYIRLEAGALELLDHDTCSIGGEGAASTDLEVTSVGKIGPYTIIDVLGRGGMGVVFRAFHEGLKRPVALKTLHAAAYNRPESLARFRVEGEAVARLDHPNIVRVYDSGESDGQQYLAMELIEGETLALRLGRDTMGHQDITRLVRSLAAAIGYAHDQNVIHRDLKPSNVLITRGGIPKVVDFGLARVIGESPQLTASDAVMGTPSYMAPEQAAGRVADINEQTDIYALGVILYEALTGAPPFVGESKLRIIQMVRKGEFAPPSQSNPEIPPALETICLRCLEPLQKDRYRGAHELVQELDRLLEGKPIQTRRPSRWRWVGRAARRRAPVALAVLLLATGLVGATAALIPQQQAAAIPNGESESVRRELEVELDKGRPVTLVGETGYPKWFRWRVGKNAQRTHIEPDGTFSAEVIQKNVIGVLELLPETRTDRYKLTAQVRHDVGGYGGFVGLYVGHRTYPWQTTEIHCLHHTRFSAVTRTPLILRPNGKPVVTDNETFHMSLVTRLHTGAAAPLNLDQELNEVAGGRMVALGPRNGVWHDFELDVSPDGIVATMAGHVMKIPGADLTPEALFLKAAQLRGCHPEDPAIQNLRPEFTPRGGLGLIVFPNNAASIRRVTVTPQPK
ncbi:MAG: hypothetical protein C0467_12460 [Planctomycetaceae bacterium]|nr:hypothetical protein [Planctomycetaceae bacterium]